MKDPGGIPTGWQRLQNALGADFENLCSRKHKRKCKNVIITVLKVTMMITARAANLLPFFLRVCVHACMPTHKRMHILMCMWRSKENLQ